MTDKKEQQPQSRDEWRQDFRSRLDGAAAQSLGIELTEETTDEAAKGGEKKDNE